MSIPSSQGSSHYRYQHRDLPDHEVHWRVNLRTNFRLWPEPTPNIQALLRCVGQPYDEEEFLREFERESESDAAAGAQPAAQRDARVVRNTLEALATLGLAVRDRNDVLELTPLGNQVFSFLGLHGEESLANEHNLELVAEPLIRGLSGITEVRAIWMLMRLADDRLSNEELNRAMRAVNRLSDVEEVAQRVLDARSADDPSRIGDRIYEPAKYGTDQASDQRKAMNPQFLLAGGGGIFVSVEPSERERRIEEWAAPLIDVALSQELPLLHASADMVTTDSLRARQISKYASLSPDLRAKG